MSASNRTLVATVVAVVGLGAAATAVALFPRAFPAIALENTLTPATALARADSFFRAHDLAPTATRRAVAFRGDDSLLTYVDLAAGGTDSVNSLVRGRDAALFVWSVRAFDPGDVRESRVDFAPDGRVIGFERKLAEADVRPDIGADSAQTLARHVLAAWLGDHPDRWVLATSSYETRKESGRVDRKFTFERLDRKIGDAPLRIDITVGGDTPVGARPYVYVPESFSRRYDEMRSANDLLSLFSTVGMIGLLILGFWSLRIHSRAGVLRWKGAVVVGAVTGAFITAAGINALGSAWYAYDTATPAGIFQAIVLGGAVAAGVLMAVVVTLTLAAAEAATRSAFPQMVDWWKLWTYRGTREVAGQVAGGYVAAAVALAYVAAFYVVTRGLFGWWVPSSLLDDPNQIATPAPWITGIALSLQAGVWEEALFRALPLSLLALWVGDRPHRGWWMAGGVIATAIVFGFAHSSYPSWPPYSRGVEIFLDACFWGVLFLRFGLLLTVLAHFSYNLVLFSLFTATGSAPEYRIAAAFAALALLTPALAVAWKAWRQGGLVETPDEARFAAWKRDDGRAQPTPLAARIAPTDMSLRSRQLAVLAVVVAIVGAVVLPRSPARGPAFTATRATVLAVADSIVAARGVVPADWRRLTGTATDTLAAWPRFLARYQAESLAVTLAPTYAVPAWWVVRYVHTEGTLAERAEEWRVRVLPDGQPLDVRRIVPDSAPGDSPAPDSARRIARRALAAAGVDTLHLREADFVETQRPRRRDATVTWIDTTISLPAGASARAWVSLAGSDVLVTRRGIELPEAFQRAERDRQTRMVAVSALFGSLLFGGLIAGIVFVARRRVALITDRTFDRSTGRALVALLAVTAIVGSFSTWPASLFSYDTSVPWSTHVTQAAVTSAFTIVGALLVAALWMVFEMLRTRTGIAAWPDAAARTDTHDALTAGVGLGAVYVAGRLIRDVAAPRTVGAAPATSLNDLLPLMDGALAVPSDVALMVVLMAIPLLMIFAISPVSRTRWLFIVLFLVLGGATIVPAGMSASASGIDVTKAAVALASGLAFAVALYGWAPRGAYSWIVAALTASALTQLRQAVHDPTGVEQVSGMVGAAVAIAALLWLRRRSARPDRAAPQS